jgi:DNA-nicking Smr family endonuclease
MHNPFKSLEKDPALRSRLPKRRHRTASATPRQTALAGVDEDREENLFLRAVSDATPLSAGGRDIAAAAGDRAAASLPPQPFARLVEEDIEFEIECSHEYLTGQIRGLDAKIFRKLKAGEMNVQGHLDLHGMNAEQAHYAVVDFLRRSYMEGKRCVLLIPGRGRNSPLGQGILRQELSTWLTRAPLKRVVLAFATAQPRHGGSGAVYLLLRQVRKDRGTIVWEDVFADLNG